MPSLLKVSSKSTPNSVAGALAGIVREQGVVEVQVIGAGALNQAIKAVAIARGFVTASGIELVVIPSFSDVVIDGENRTAIRLRVEDRHLRTTRAEAKLSELRVELGDEEVATAQDPSS